MKIVIANDHAAVTMKKEVCEYLIGLGHDVINIGIDREERCNYPDYAEEAAGYITSGKADLGVLICGTGAGMAIAANKVKGIRAVVCSEPVTARLAREHNHANIITFGARVIGYEMATAILDAYLNAEELGGRHEERVNLITQIEERG